MDDDDIDAPPRKWADTLPVILRAFKHSHGERGRRAGAELERMAAFADRAVAQGYADAPSRDWIGPTHQPAGPLVTRREPDEDDGA